MGAGQMRTSITIQDPNTSQDALGEEVKSPSTLATVWARKIEKSGKEYFTQSGEVAQAAVVYQVYYRSDVTTDHIIVDGSRTLDIVSIVPDAREMMMEIICRENIA